MEDELYNYIASYWCNIVPFTAIVTQFFDYKEADLIELLQTLEHKSLIVIERFNYPNKSKYNALIRLSF